MPNWITYETKHNTIGGGYAAEFAESPLSGALRVRVCDTLQECGDPDAGKWISCHDVIDDGQVKGQWLHNPAN